MFWRLMWGASVLVLAACGDQQTATNTPTTTGTSQTSRTTTSGTSGTATPSSSSSAPSATGTASTSPGSSGTTSATPGPTGASTSTTGTTTGASPPVTGAGGPSVPALASLQGKPYSAGPITLTLKPDNSFEMRSNANSESVQGTYTYTEGVLTFSRVSGDVGGASFPMKCRVEGTPAGFQLTDVGNCTYFRDLKFTSI